MNEYRAKILKKITKKIQALIDEADLLISAELQNIDEYQTCEAVCRSMTDGKNMLIRALFYMHEAEQEAELEDIQDNMQQSLDHLSVS